MTPPLIFRLFEWIGKPLYRVVVFFLRQLQKETLYTRRSYENYRDLTRKKLSDPIIVFQAPHLSRFDLFHRRWLPISTILIGILLFTSTSLQFWYFVYFEIPSPEDLKSHTPHLTTKMYDRNGVLLYSMFRDENRTLISLSQVPQSLIDATLSIEDKDFFSHPGVSIPGILRAVRHIVSGQGVQGGSTITQQLVKTVLLSPERTLARKIKEAIIALRVERHFSKQEILQMYLNEVSYGGSLYGIEAASEAYFGIDSANLSLAQSAFLAGLPAAPSLYNPFGSYPERGKERQREVLRRMYEDGKISAAELEKAKNEPLVFSQNTQPIIAPHFVMYVKEQLAREYGEDTLTQGGLEITTTLDSNFQAQVQEIVTKEVSTLTRLRVGNGAALVTNPKTGEILAMVGSTNFFDTAHDGQVNVTIRERQPGSSIKPLTYATALERGYTPATLIDDSPISFSIAGSPPYTPQNYDGRFHGNVTLRTALASSYNIPAVKALASVGLQAVIEKGKTLGISTWDQPSRYGLSLTLGGAEIKMIDMAVLYGTFANQGINVPLQFIKTIKTSAGKTIFQNPCIDTPTPCGGKRALDPRIAYQITNILMDNTARSPAFGSHSVLVVPDHQVAVKTGTTNVLRDNWTNGYTTDRVVLVWVGNNDNTPMSRITSGVIGASPIWNSIMSLTLKGQPRHVFPIPANVEVIAICRRSGTLACGRCTSDLTEYFLPGTAPTQCPQPSESPTPESDSHMRASLDNSPRRPREIREKEKNQ